MKNFIVIAILILSFSCKDQVSKADPEIREIRTPNLCPPNGPYPHPPVPQFAGIESIDDIEQTRATIHWTGIPDARAYMVLQSKDGEDFELVHTRNTPGQRAIINNLLPNTTYEFQVKYIDSRGMPDLNEKILTATTLQWPIYNNAKSINLNGVKSINIGPSEEFAPNNTFTASLWMKSNDSSQSDSRLINFHRGTGAGSSVYLGVAGSNLILGYRDRDGNFKTENISSNIIDNSWHNIVLTYNKRFYAVYIDGARVKMIEDTFIGMGSHPLHIGSYTGTQKAFVGSIDEVSFWSSSLGSRNAIAIYNHGSPFNILKHDRAHTIISWYRMGDDSRDTISTIMDQVGANNGSPNNLRTNDFISDAP